MSPHFYVSSNGDSFVMLVSTFATDITDPGTIEYPTTTTHIYFTTYYPPSVRQYVTYRSGFLADPRYICLGSAPASAIKGRTWFNFSLKWLKKKRLPIKRAVFLF